MGVAVLDYNGDGWPDLFVGSDRVPAKLYRNDGHGHFVDEAVRAGVALSENGVARANMGTDAADYDRSGRPHIVVGNFVNEMLGLYHNENGSLFRDVAPAFRGWPREPARGDLGDCSSSTADLDGFPDIFAANGGTDESQGRDARARIEPGSAAAAEPRQRHVRERHRVAGRRRSTDPIMGRGAAYLDFDGDGDLDVVDDDARRPGVCSFATTAAIAQLAARAGGRHEIESQRHRRGGARHERVGHAVADGPQRVELRVPERADADLRPWRGHESDAESKLRGHPARPSR